MTALDSDQSSYKQSEEEESEPESDMEDVEFSGKRCSYLPVSSFQTFNCTLTSSTLSPFLLQSVGRRRHFAWLLILSLSLGVNLNPFLPYFQKSMEHYM